MLLGINKLKDGDIMCASDKSFFGIVQKSIQALTKSDFNHVGIFINGYIYEANPRGFEKTPIKSYISRYNKGKLDLKFIRVNPDEFDNLEDYNNRINKAIDRSILLVGKRYDFSAIIGFVGIAFVKYWLRKTHWKLNFLQNKNKVFCSESVCKVFHYASDNVSLFVGENDKEATCSTVSPKDIAKSKKCVYVTGNSNLV